MKVRIFGPGCPNCERLEQNVINAAAALNMVADIQKVEDPAEMAKMGVMSTPALAIGEEVVVTGRVPDVKQIKELMEQKTG